MHTSLHTLPEASVDADPHRTVVLLERDRPQDVEYHRLGDGDVVLDDQYVGQRASGGSNRRGNEELLGCRLGPAVGAHPAVQNVRRGECCLYSSGIGATDVVREPHQSPQWSPRQGGTVTRTRRERRGGVLFLAGDRGALCGQPCDPDARFLGRAMRILARGAQIVQRPCCPLPEDVGEGGRLVLPDMGECSVELINQPVPAVQGSVTGPPRTQ